MYINYKDKLLKTFDYSLGYAFSSVIIIMIFAINSTSFPNPPMEWLWGLNFFLEQFIKMIFFCFFISIITFVAYISSNLKEFYKNIFYYWIGLIIFIFLLSLALVLLTFIFYIFGNKTVSNNFLTAFYLMINFKYIFFPFTLVLLLRILQLLFKKIDNFFITCVFFDRPEAFPICLFCLTMIMCFLVIITATLR